MCQAAWDLERGLAGRPAVKAEATLTLVLPKAALRIEEAQALVGANLPRRHLDLGRGYEGLRIPYRSARAWPDRATGGLSGTDERQIVPRSRR